MTRFLGPQEDVPKEKKYMISTRENSEYKWHADGVLGALEVPCDPEFDLHGQYRSRHVDGMQDDFDSALQVWDDLKLREGFIQASSDLPHETCCCGLLRDDDATIKGIVPLLNKGWIRQVNKEILAHVAEQEKQRQQDEDAGDDDDDDATPVTKFKLDAFLWQWHNATGKSETNILLIRFFQVE